MSAGLPRITLRTMNYSEAEQNAAEGESGSPVVETVVDLIIQIARRVHCSMADHAQSWGLTPAQAKMLLHLGRHGPTPVGELAAALGGSMPAASELVDRLVDAGMVQRDDDPADRRRVIITPSPAAQQFANELRQQRAVQVGDALNCLSAGHRPVLVQGLDLLLTALGDEQIRSGAASPARAAKRETGPATAALLSTGRTHTPSIS